MYVCLNICMVKFGIDNHCLILSLFLSFIPYSPFLTFVSASKKITDKGYEETNQTPPVDGGI